MPKNGNAPKTLLESLDALVAKHHLLKHPFYKAWTEGKLSKAQLGLYAEQYYQHVPLVSREPEVARGPHQWRPQPELPGE